MKQKIKINFADFWGGFSKVDNYFYNLLVQNFDVDFSNNPDYLFFSVFGQNHLNYKCKKIMYLGENMPPDMNYCDYAFSFEPTTDRNYKLPHYLLYDGYYELINKKVDDSMLNRKFCSFLVNNGASKERNDFFLKLSKYKKIDSGGQHYNNIGYLVGANKKEFQNQYKFALCFENGAYRLDYPYYITEKPFQALQNNTIPLYRGGSEIVADFNTKAMVNYHDFNNEDDMIEYIIELDKNDDKYMSVLRQPAFVNNEIPENNKLENIKKFLYSIFI